MIKKNLTLKLLAFAITLIIYYFVAAKVHYTEVKLKVPVVFNNLPKDKIILHPANRDIDVILRGVSNQVTRAFEQGVELTADLPDGLKNSYELIVNSKDIDLPKGVEVVGINPAKLNLIFDDVIEKKYTINVPQLGKLPEGYRLVSLETEPQFISVSGPRSEIEAIEHLETNSLDIRTITESGSGTLDLVRPTQNAQLETSKVVVSYKVESIRNTKIFDNLAIELRTSLSEQVILSEYQANIVLSGPVQKLAAITPDEIDIFVRVGKRNINNSELPVKVNLPEGFNLISVKPESVSIKKE